MGFVHSSVAEVLINYLEQFHGLSYILLELSIGENAQENTRMYKNMVVLGMMPGLEVTTPTLAVG